MKIQCTACGKAHTIKEKMIGRKVKCGCGKTFRIQVADHKVSLRPQQKAVVAGSPSQVDTNDCAPSPKEGIQISKDEQSPVHSDEFQLTVPSPSEAAVAKSRAAMSKAYSHWLIWFYAGTVLLLIAFAFLWIFSGKGTDTDTRTATGKSESIESNTDATSSSNQLQNSSVEKPGDRNESEETSLLIKQRNSDAFLTNGPTVTKNVPNEHAANEILNDLARSTTLFIPDTTTTIRIPIWSLPELDPKEAISGLASGDKQEDFVEILIRGGKNSVAPLINTLRASDGDAAAPYSAFQLTQILSRIGKPALKPLLDVALDSTLTNSTRQNAIRAIGEMGPMAAPAIPDLVSLFENESESRLRSLRISSLDAISKIGVMTSGVKKILTEIFTDSNSPSNYLTIAFLTVKKTGPEAAPLVPHFLQHLRTSKIHAQEAAEAIQSIGVGASSAAADLIQLIAADNRVVSYRAYHALRELGTEAREAVPILLQKIDLAGSDSQQRNAAEILGRIGPPAVAALPVLKKRLRDAEQNRFDQASRVVYQLAIARIEGDQRTAIPYLKNALFDNQHNARAAAAQQIGTLGKDGQELVPELCKIIVDVETKHSVVRLAIQSLGQLGPYGADGTGTLISFINREQEKASGQKTYRLQAIESIAKINPDERVPAGLRQLAHHDPDEQVRTKATRLLQYLTQ